MKPRLSEKRVFDESIRGVYGTFGWGAAVQVAYVQAAVRPQDLRKISLVAEIEGSDRWPVRDLFQREVDADRVAHSILPWLQDTNRVKFFNPLTLALIPFDLTTKAVLPSIPSPTRSQRRDELGDEWVELAAEDLYQFRWRLQDEAEYPEFAEVSWSSAAIRLVAIDGQHRLSALKRYLSDIKGPAHETFLRWSIPVVVTGLYASAADPGTRRPTYLDVVRHVFVYINTQAKPPTLARQILLDDTDVNYICVQELLQSFHENELRNAESRDLTVPPLSLFDWRGATVDGKETPSPIALKGVVELAAWFEQYLLGESFSDDQLEALGIAGDEPLGVSFHGGAFRPGDHLALRERFREHALPGITHLLKAFGPYQRYIAEVRRIEAAAERTSDESRHALSWLRFGTHRGNAAEQQRIQTCVGEIVHDVLDARAFPLLLLEDIGMRGIVWAFGAMRWHHGQWRKSRDGWLAFAEWFTSHLNRVEKDGWFAEAGHPLRQYITNTPAGDVINFKLEHAGRALGALVLLAVAAYAAGEKDVITPMRFDELWESYATGDVSLSSTLRSGYRKRYMEELAEQHPNWARRKREEEAVPRANKAAAAHLTRLRKRLDEIRGA